MKIVHVASELFPYMKTGGLADAVGALGATLADKGHEVSAFLPGYALALEHADAVRAERRLRLKIEMGDEFLSGDIRAFSPRHNLTVYVVCREEFFDRKNPYGNGERDYEDNADRFIFFCKAVVETIRLLDLQPDIVHGHDWQAALLPLLLREEERRHGVTLAVKTVFTIHNIAYQGLFPLKAFVRTNLAEELRGIEGLEYYGQINFMKGGILFADRVTTVSPTYAKEIQTPEFGCGLEGVVQSRTEDIAGILNGVDTETWNPEVDPSLPARYSARDLSGKKACRKALMKAAGFPADFAGPIFGMVCRFVEQKGIDLILANKAVFEKNDCKLAILGAGERRYEEEVRDWSSRHPEKIFMHSGVDEAMSHLIEAGSDFFVMPSHFEPCGLNQMYSQVYGTVPIASRVGGLVDTVIDIEEHPDTGTGILCKPTSAGLAGGLVSAMALFADPLRYAAAQKRGMGRDFSWKRAAVAYEKLYHDSI